MGRVARAPSRAVRRAPAQIVRRRCGGRQSKALPRDFGWVATSVQCSQARDLLYKFKRSVSGIDRRARTHTRTVRAGAARDHPFCGFNNRLTEGTGYASATVVCDTYGPSVPLQGKQRVSEMR